MSAEQRDTKVVAASEGAPPAGPGDGPAVTTPSTATPTSAPASPTASEQAAGGADSSPPATSEPPAGGSKAAATGGDDGPSPGPSAAPGADDVAPHDDGEQVSLDLDELAAKAAERDEYLALAQRTQADFENYRKRVARDAAQAELRGIARLAKELLPGIDNLERALAAQEGQNAQLAEGVKLVQAELIAALARVGLEAYSPHGERFDPELHEAMAQQPAEGVESGTIIEVYQPGYRLDGNVIRPARVVVAA
jgi:molecular chaperone GrpE